jgi:glucosyl-dolichyl phosphate glucuronosyltransferase
MDPVPSISVIITTSSRPGALAETLRSLSAVRVPETWLVELLLVENATHSGAEQQLRTFPNKGFAAVKFLFEPIRGKSRALNLAITHANGAILLFSDDDVRFPVDWVERMCKPIADGRADAVAGGVKVAPSLLRPWMNRTQRAWLASTADYLSIDEPSEMCGANMAVRRIVFNQIGGFDTELGPGITGGGEESLLTWQLKTAGFRLAGALDLQVEHHFDPERLKYQSWIRAARGKGQTRAYLMHHWHHKSIRNPWLTQLYYRTKLSLRKRVSMKEDLGREGIASWEMSYIEGIAACVRYISERSRPRNYSFNGLRKLVTDRPAPTP